MSNEKLEKYLNGENDDEKPHLFCDYIRRYIDTLTNERTKELYIATERKMQKYCSYDFLIKWSGTARQVLEALLEKYMNHGIYDISKTEILKLDPFAKLGKPQKIASFFGGKDGYLKAVQELEDAIYEKEA